MIEKLMTVVIVVKDQARALDFYTRVLGFEKRTDFTPPGNARWVTVAPKGQDIEIRLVPSRFLSRSKGAPKSIATREQLTVDVADQRLPQRFRRAQITWRKVRSGSARRISLGILATFSDPDGNAFALLQPPRKA